VPTGDLQVGQTQQLVYQHDDRWQPSTTLLRNVHEVCAVSCTLMRKRKASVGLIVSEVRASHYFGLSRVCSPADTTTTRTRGGARKRDIDGH
jgi:hypothetical protein